MPKNHKKIYTADFVLLLVSFSIPFGWTMSGLPPSIELACACWAVTLGVLLHCFWVSTGKWNFLLRLLIVVIVPVLALYYSWQPIKKQYALQHTEADQSVKNHQSEPILAANEFENVLGEQSTTFFISAKNPTWQPTYKLRSNEWALIELGGTTNRTWITDSGKGSVSAEGYSNTFAGKDFRFPNMPEGSLLIQAGDGRPFYWTNKAKSFVVHTNGTISFTANDDLANNADSYGDNIGYMGVKITISTNLFDISTNNNSVTKTLDSGQ